MARGFITGTVWGLVVGTSVAAIGSLYIGMSKSALPNTSDISVPAGSGFNGARTDEQVTLPAKIGAPERPTAPSVTTPQAEEISLSVDATAPVQTPEVSRAPEMSTVAPVVKTDPGLGTPLAQESTPVLPNVSMEQPSAPSKEAIVGLSQDPSQPALPEVDTTEPENPISETAEVLIPAEPDATPKLPKVENGDPAPKEDQKQDLVLEDGQRALDIFKAVEVDAKDAPLVSIVFIDDGKFKLDIAALEALPFPVSFAVDASWDGAGEAQQSYFNAGYEVAAMVNLPENANGQDVETTLASSFATVNHSVAFVEQAQGALQVTRDATKQVVTFAKETGHGLVYFDKGLNSGVSGALKDGVPAITIYRDLDNDNQDERTIRRFLDGAAFRAKQQGQIVLLARLRPETISALLLWALQDRAKTVALAPLSQVLRNVETN